MINIKIKDNKVIISGHANYKYSNDIVCASVSSIMYTTINAIAKINKDNVKFSDNGNCIIEYNKEDKITNILIENMISLYYELESDYPKNIRIESEE